MRGGGSTRFQANRRASIDHRPGPNIARAPPMVPGKRGTQRSPATVIICRVSSKASSAPTMGVHSPEIRRSPIPAKNADITIVSMGGSLHTADLACATSAEPGTKRMRSNPMPGQPPAKVEYRRRKTHLSKPYKFPTLYRQSKPPKESRSHSFEFCVRLRRGGIGETTAR